MTGVLARGLDLCQRPLSISKTIKITRVSLEVPGISEKELQVHLEGQRLGRAR